MHGWAVKTAVLCDVDGVLTDGSVYVSSDGGETLRFHKRDGVLIEAARKAGIVVVLVTDDPNPAPARHRAEKLGVGFCSTVAGELTTTPPSANAEHAVKVWRYHSSKLALVQLWRRAGYRVVFIGDSAADAEAMAAADVSWRPVNSMHRDSDMVAMCVGGNGVLYEVLAHLLGAA